MSKSHPDNANLTVELPPDVADRFRARARAEYRSTAAQLRLLIHQYLANNGEGAGQGASADDSVERDRVSAAA